MKPLSLALSIEWDDCTVALAGEHPLTGSAYPPQESSARILLGSDGGAQASRHALTLLHQALEQAGQSLAAVERFYVNVGPGAFTSLRVAVGLIQGLALPRARPVGAVGSLQALAATVPDWRFPLDEVRHAPAHPAQADDTKTGQAPWLLCSALDARLGECYYGAFLCQAGHWPRTVLPVSVGPATQAATAFEALRQQQQADSAPCAIHLAGNGFAEPFEALRAWAMEVGQDAILAAQRRPTASAVLALADTLGAPALLPARDLRPEYVRQQVALDRDQQRMLAATRQSGAPRRRGS